ncbi:MAG: UDP-N-acetylmuramoyl-L-alanyl-D-glutamate--2,6-diaminopimelate ligase [Deltaproteobacteria bacterium]|nr:UDP-N-acetylmuramoyl-L-alanyl-D-glutamate--2,6-diaminopimelate ligase [Deltaproteobacteria bacterium]
MTTAARKSRSLAELLAAAPPLAVHGRVDRPVTAVTADSRRLPAGGVFVAVRGTAADGHRFLAEAWRRGAAAVVVDREEVFRRESRQPANAGRTICLAADSRRTLAAMAAAWYGHPARSLQLVGITGTNGKTTVAYLLECLLSRAGAGGVGVIGTVSYRWPGAEEPAANTTPGPEKLQQLLARMVAAGVSYCVMEVSSHALDQERVADLPFAVTVFTNLSHDHLDYHREMEAYYQAKKKLFTGAWEAAAKIINRDDSWGARLLAEAAPPKFSCSCRAAADYQVTELALSAAGSRFRLTAAGRNFSLATPLIGRFNVDNVLAAVAAADRLGCPLAAVGRELARLPQVPGRLERVPNDRRLHLFIDYAHTPDALEKVLQALREVAGAGRLLTLFGCGGDRDRQKRPLMGRLAQRYSDLVVVTSDNPRLEEPQAIIADILAGMEVDGTVLVEPDRRRAIEKLLAASRPGDLVLVAGKGHETYQEIGAEKIPFADREVLREVLAA